MVQNFFWDRIRNHSWQVKIDCDVSSVSVFLRLLTNCTAPAKKSLVLILKKKSTKISKFAVDAIKQ